jgi:hypothetical protein
MFLSVVVDVIVVVVYARAIDITNCHSTLQYSFQVLGARGLLGLLTGAISSGFLLGVTMANAGKCFFLLFCFVLFCSSFVSSCSSCC